MNIKINELDRAIVLDTETTGLKVSEGHRLIEIGCLEIKNFIPTGKTFHVYINPNRNVSEEAFKIHGLDNNFLFNKPFFKEIANNFLKFCGADPLIIHNAKFDIDFLNYELQKSGLSVLKQTFINKKIIDTLAIARNRYPTSPNSLNALCRRFNISIKNRKFHGALLDSQLLAEVYVELMGGRQINFVDSCIKDTSISIKNLVILKQKKRLNKLKNLVTCTELREHKKFINTEIGQRSIWHKLYN